MQSTRLRPMVLLLGLSLVAGCSSDRLPTYPVQGRVVFRDGAPVRTGSVELRSRDHRIHARGDIADDGSFQLTTYDDNDGAVEGDHQCVVVQLVMVEELDNFKPSTDGVVDPRFGSYSKSRLECQVSSTGTNEVTLTVETLKTSLTSDNAPGTSLHGHSHHHHQHDHRQEAKQ